MRRALFPGAFARLLRTERIYARPPVLDRGTQSIRAALEQRPSDAGYGFLRRGAPVEVMLGALGGRLVARCTCWAAENCVHIGGLLVDLVVHPPLLEAVLGGCSTGELLLGLPAARKAVLAEYEAEAFVASLAPRAPVQLEVCAVPQSLPSSRVEVHLRRVGRRALLGAGELEALHLSATDRRLLDVLAPLRGKKAFVAAGPSASLLLELLRRRSVWTNGFRQELRFSEVTVAPRASASAHPDGGVLLTFDWLAADGLALDPAKVATFSGPSPCVWSIEHGAVFSLAQGVDVDIAFALAAHRDLVVEPRQLARVGLALFQAGQRSRVVIPPREAVGLPALEVPELRLELDGSPLDVQGRLLARYSTLGDLQLDIDEPRDDHAVDGAPRALPTSAPDASGVRDFDRERRAVALVRNAGFERTPEGGLVAAGEAAVSLWSGGVQALRAAEPPLTIMLSESLARARVGGEVRARVRVSLEDGWLRARVDFEADELAVELETIRAALAGARRWVALADGTLARLTDEVATLTEDVTATLGGAAEGRLPAHQLGRVGRWAEESSGELDAPVLALRERLRALAISPAPALPRAFGGELRTYQLEALAWLQFLGELGAGGILADDMGLGKTVVTLAFLLERRDAEGGRPSLVVCPTSVAGNWVREAARFAPDLRVLLLHGGDRSAKAPEIATHDLVVTTYALLRRDIETLETFEFRAVVLDEAQNIKNAQAVTTRAAQRLRGATRLALSGTPVENRLGELWSLLSFVNPGILGTARDFEVRFERPITLDPRGPAAARLRALVRPFILRRTKAQVLRELPPKTEVERVCVFTPEQKRLYDALAHVLRARVERAIAERGLDKSGINVLAALTRLRQMACDPRLIDGRARAASSAKRSVFLELVRELVAEGRRALVFSQFVQLFALWRKDLDREGIRYEYLDGSTRDRDVVVARFRDGDAPLFLISLRAGGTGLNLVEADTVIHCDPWWNPAVEDQATDRAHRIGQSRPVTVVRLVARGTIEEKIGSLKGKKRALAGAVVGEDAGALRGLSTADVSLLLGDLTGDVAESDGDPVTPTDAPEEPGETGEGREPSEVEAPKEISSPEKLAGPERTTLDEPRSFDDLRADARAWLAELGARQRDLALAIGASPTTMSRYLSGQGGLSAASEEVLRRFVGRPLRAPPRP